MQKRAYWFNTSKNRILSLIPLKLSDYLNGEGENNTPDFRSKIKKFKSTKKSKYKTAFINLVKEHKSYESYQVPFPLLSLIKNQEQLITINFSESEQQEIFKFLTEFPKYIVFLKFFLSASNEDEITYVKNVMLSEGFFEWIFNKINYKII